MKDYLVDKIIEIPIRKEKNYGVNPLFHECGMCKTIIGDTKGLNEITYTDKYSKRTIGLNVCTTCFNHELKRIRTILEYGKNNKQDE